MTHQIAAPFNLFSCGGEYPSSEPLKECFLTQSKKSFNMYLSEKKKSEAPDESEATTPKLQADDLINFR